MALLMLQSGKLPTHWARGVLGGRYCGYSSSAVEPPLQGRNTLSSGAGVDDHGRRAGINIEFQLLNRFDTLPNSVPQSSPVDSSVAWPLSTGQRGELVPASQSQNTAVAVLNEPSTSLAALRTAASLATRSLKAASGMLLDRVGRLRKALKGRVRRQVAHTLKQARSSPEQTRLRLLARMLQSNGGGPSPFVPRKSPTKEILAWEAQLIKAVMRGHKSGATMSAGQRRAARQVLHSLKPLTAMPGFQSAPPWMLPRNIALWRLGKCSHLWHKLNYLLQEPRVTRVKSKITRQMLELQTRDQIIDRLLVRYGIFKQFECFVIRSPKFKCIASIWARMLVDRFEYPTRAASPYYLPPELLVDQKVQSIAAGEVDIFWFLGRIYQNSSEFDDLPQPHYPKHFESRIDGPLLHPKRLMLYTKFYGLAKWPFVHSSDKQMLGNKLI